MIKETILSIVLQVNCNTKVCYLKNKDFGKVKARLIRKEIGKYRITLTGGNKYICAPKFSKSRIMVLSDKTSIKPNGKPAIYNLEAFNAYMFVRFRKKVEYRDVNFVWNCLIK